jgi:hypothetical protein
VLVAVAFGNAEVLCIMSHGTQVAGELRSLCAQYIFSMEQGLAELQQKVMGVLYMA